MREGRYCCKAQGVLAARGWEGGMQRCRSAVHTARRAGNVASVVRVRGATTGWWAGRKSAQSGRQYSNAQLRM